MEELNDNDENNVSKYNEETASNHHINNKNHINQSVLNIRPDSSQVICFYFIRHFV